MENTKWIQIIVLVFKLVAISLMLGCSITHLSKEGMEIGDDDYYSFRARNIEIIFGNCLFITVFHHSIPGIVYPSKPQKHLRRSISYSYCIAFAILALESIFAILAYGTDVGSAKHHHVLFYYYVFAFCSFWRVSLFSFRFYFAFHFWILFLIHFCYSFVISFVISFLFGFFVWYFLCVIFLFCVL